MLDHSQKEALNVFVWVETTVHVYSSNILHAQPTP